MLLQCNLCIYSFAEYMLVRSIHVILIGCRLLTNAVRSHTCLSVIMCAHFDEVYTLVWNHWVLGYAYVWLLQVSPSK